MRYTLFFIIAFSCWFNSAAQQISYVKFQFLEVDYKPKHFYIRSFIDEREDSSNIGSIDTHRKTVIYKLKDIVPTLEKFNSKLMKSDTGKLPVEIRVKEMKLSKKQVAGQLALNLYMDLRFYSKGKYLYYWKGNTPMAYKIDPAIECELLVKLLLEQAYEEFDDWLKENKHKAAETISVKTEIVKNSDDTTLLVFNKNTQLHVSDFRGAVDSTSPLEALPYMTMLYVYNWRTDVSNKMFDVRITTSVDREKSWIKANTSTQRLIYLQNFFYIYALKACELKRIADTTHFSYDNAMKDFDSLYRKINRSAFLRLEEYAKETEGYSSWQIVEKWTARLKKEIEECGCYN